MDITQACHTLTSKLVDSQVDLVSETWIKDSAVRHVLRSLAKGDYHNLPTPIYDEIMSYARTFLAENQSQFVIAIDTMGPARVMFLCPIVVTLRGVEIGTPAVYAVPDDTDDIEVAPEVAGVPVVAFDLTLPE